MATQETLFYLSIINGPPELDFLFALARRGPILLTISLERTKKDLWVFVDSIGVPKEERFYSWHPQKKKSFKGNTWLIDGHFCGNGKDSWQDFKCEGSTDKVAKKYVLWGRFDASYDKRKRKGSIRPWYYREEIS